MTTETQTHYNLEEEVNELKKEIALKEINFNTLVDFKKEKTEKDEE
jgi:hypothetical protein